MATTMARTGGEYIAFLMTRCGCTRVVKMTGASPPLRMKLPMFSRQRLIVDPNMLPAPMQGPEVDTRVFLLNEGAQEELFGMPAYQFLEELP